MEKPIVEIKKIEKQRIIYISFSGTYIEFRKNSRKLFNKLFSFAESKGLIDENITKVLTMYNDDPRLVKGDAITTSVAMTVPETTLDIDNDEIKTAIIAGKFLVGHFNLSPREYGDAWNYMYNVGLLKGKEKHRNDIPFELYVTEPPSKFNETSLTDIFIPIE